MASLTEFFKNGNTTSAINDVLRKKSKEKIGIGGFTLFARVNETINLNSKIPTTWLEDGSFAQDHIVLDPVTVSIDGEISDVFLERDALPEAITRIQSQIGAIETYLPTRSQSQIQKINAIINDAQDKLRAVDRAIDNGKQLYNFFTSNTSGKGNREIFIDYAEIWHKGKQLISIETPWRVYERMAIISLSIVRGNEEEAISFKLTAQEIRFAETIYRDINQYFKKPSDGIEGKADSVVNKGPQKPKEVDESLLSTVDRVIGSPLKKMIDVLGL